MNRKLFGKAGILVISAVPIIILITMIYNEIKYMTAIRENLASSQLAYESTRQSIYENSTTPKEVAKQVIKTDTKSMNISTVSPEISNSSTPKPRKNLFKALHKYSVHNPDFRHLMEWPPLPDLPPENPTLVQLINQTISDADYNFVKFHLLISKYHLYEDTPLIDAMLHDLATKKIVAVEQYPGGTQFKLIVEFEDGSVALFKPQRYPKDQERGKNVVYNQDFERAHSEIAAFHLDRILGFRRSPPVTGRRINIMKDIFNLARPDLRETFFYSPDGNICFYGNCTFFCDVGHAFCGDPYTIEGSFAIWLPPLTTQFIRSPWRRSYLVNVKTAWETDPDYCFNFVLKTEPFIGTRRIYDSIDCAIYDFLMGNEDRHHYEEFLTFGFDDTPTIILNDNGRGFGRSDHDEMSIITPLVQCCIIRLSTFNKLYSFHAGSRPLSDFMRESLQKDPTSPVLTEAHLLALDRRVDKILQIIQDCIKANYPAFVFWDDIVMGDQT